MALTVIHGMHANKGKADSGSSNFLQKNAPAEGCIFFNVSMKGDCFWEHN
jgi:hypothetical protein